MRASHLIFVLSLLTARLGAQSPAAERDARWREDVRFMARELPARHLNAFAYVDRNTFERAAAKLDSTFA
jgi:hypothetical protein